MVLKFVSVSPQETEMNFINFKTKIIMVSKELLFKECELHHHCIGLHLKRPITVGLHEVATVYLMSIVLDEQQKQELLQNIVRNVNPTLQKKFFFTDFYLDFALF